MRLYGLLNLLFAALYLYLGYVVADGRSRLFDLTLAALCGLLAAAGVGLLLRARWGRPLAFGACGLLLLFAFCLLGGLVASTAYLRGIYGPLGKGMVTATFVVMALVVELFVLLPWFELRALLRASRA